MTTTHVPSLVLLTGLVALAAAFVTAELYAHAFAIGGRSRALWLAGAAATAVAGVWSVHLVGMLSLRLHYAGGADVPIHYDLLYTLLPGLVAAVPLALGTAVVAGLAAPRPARATAGLLLAAALVGAHFAEVAAVRAPVAITHDAARVAVAVLVAVVGSLAVTAMAGSARPWSRIGVVGIGGLTVAATHFVAISAARFAPTGEPLPLGTRHLLANDALAVAAAAVVLLTLGLAFLVLTLDRRVRAQRAIAEHQAALYRDAEAARAQVEESERRFRVLADTGPAMVWLADAAGRRTFVGQKWRDFTGHADASRNGGDGGDGGDDWAETIDGDDRGRCLDAYREAIAARRRFRLEYRVRRPDGARCWVLDTGVPRETVHGEFAGYVGTCIDITERREAEEGQAFLLELARVLAASLDFEALLRHVTGLLVPRVADACTVYYRGADGAYREVAAAPDDDANDGPSAVVDLAHGDGAVARALRSGEAELVCEPAAQLVVPLIARGELQGAISFAMRSPRRAFGDRDRAMAELLAARTALALDNARLYADARRARDEVLRASRLEAQLMRVRLDALRAQLNPHFLFNALNTIAMLVRRQANADALHGIVSLSELLRRALAEQNALQVPLRAELPLLESYVAIEQLRFRDRLTVRLDVAPDTLDALVPGLLLQPLVENAIKHGVANRRDGGTVGVRTRREDGMLVVVVEDDGPGFAPGWDPTSSGGIGLANTRERLARLYPDTHRFEARNRAGGGATVAVHIPFELAPPPQ